MKLTDYIKIPWGWFDFETGEWFPNENLKMSVDEQRRQNIKNGYMDESNQLHKNK